MNKEAEVVDDEAYNDGQVQSSFTEPIDLPVE